MKTLFNIFIFYFLVTVCSSSYVVSSSSEDTSVDKFNESAEGEEAEIALSVFSLEQNYPNPFNPSTIISWQSPVSSYQTLKVFDILGNEVATLVDEFKPAGKYEVEFDASEIPSGVYFYQLKTENFIETKKMILLR